MSLLLVLAYLVLSFAIGMAARRREDSRRKYVLGPGSGSLALFATMAATNFSAFTVFGLSGAGYRIGWAYYPLMAIGTGLMALSFFLIGMPLRRAAAAKSWVSPADFIADRYQSPALAKAFSLALIALTLPYLATQAMAGGKMIELVTGMPYALASFLVVGVTALYTFGGGFRTVAATDALQLAVLLGGAGIAFISILTRVGGLEALGARVAAEAPGLLAREGSGGSLPLAALLGTWLLWLLADPMFPQLFQRFYAARDDWSLARTAALYPLATGSVFFLTIGIGVAGAVLVPGLSGPATEQVFTKLALGEGSGLLASVFILAALAALMSTMDSQLLSLSSMIVQDFFPTSSRRQRWDRVLIALLAGLAWLASLWPPRLILDFLSTLAFPGYAVLAPLVIAGLYGRTGAGAAGLMLATGLGAVLLEGAGILRTAPVPQAVFNLGIQLLALLIWEIVTRGRRRSALALVRLREEASLPWLAAILAVALASSGLGSFGRQTNLVFGLPTWILSSALGCLALALTFALWKRPATMSATQVTTGENPSCTQLP
ncbi:MAG: sodium:solute symporter family protein [Spirochaetota bacterium]